MPAAISTTRWRDQPIVPNDYEDVPALVKLARRARGLVVEFDWAFSRDDLQRLRRAVYEWGSGVRGAYRCFDARVPAAINRRRPSQRVTTNPLHACRRDLQRPC